MAVANFSYSSRSHPFFRVTFVHVAMPSVACSVPGEEPGLNRKSSFEPLEKLIEEYVVRLMNSTIFASI